LPHRVARLGPVGFGFAAGRHRLGDRVRQVSQHCDYSAALAAGSEQQRGGDLVPCCVIDVVGERPQGQLGRKMRPQPVGQGADLDRQRRGRGPGAANQRLF